MPKTDPKQQDSSPRGDRINGRSFIPNERLQRYGQLVEGHFEPKLDQVGSAVFCSSCLIVHLGLIVGRHLFYFLQVMCDDVPGEMRRGIKCVKRTEFLLNWLLTEEARLPNKIIMSLWLNKCIGKDIWQPWVSKCIVGWNFLHLKFFLKNSCPCYYLKSDPNHNIYCDWLANWLG